MYYFRTVKSKVGGSIVLPIFNQQELAKLRLKPAREIRRIIHRYGTHIHRPANAGMDVSDLQSGRTESFGKDSGARSLRGRHGPGCGCLWCDRALR